MRKKTFLQKKYITIERETNYLVDGVHQMDISTNLQTETNINNTNRMQQNRMSEDRWQICNKKNINSYEIWVSISLENTLVAVAASLKIKLNIQTLL